MKPAFNVGDKVKWDESKMKNDSFGRGLKVKHGNGPFIVASTRTVTSSCTCNVSRGWYISHSEYCGVHTAKSVGHRQFVTIVGIEGSFSGAWFLPNDS